MQQQRGVLGGVGVRGGERREGEAVVREGAERVRAEVLMGRRKAEGEGDVPDTRSGYFNPQGFEKRRV